MATAEVDASPDHLSDKMSRWVDALSNLASDPVISAIVIEMHEEWKTLLRSKEAEDRWVRGPIEYISGHCGGRLPSTPKPTGSIVPDRSVRMDYPSSYERDGKMGSHGARKYPPSLPGDKFGWATVLEVLAPDYQGREQIRVRCTCGEERSIRTFSARRHPRRCPHRR